MVRQPSPHPGIASLWARRKIAGLLQSRVRGAPQELDAGLAKTGANRLESRPAGRIETGPTRRFENDQARGLDGRGRRAGAAKPRSARSSETRCADRDAARELLECFWVKFNNHPAPPKVGVTAAESGTYTDFANINLGGLLTDGVRKNPHCVLLLDEMEKAHSGIQDVFYQVFDKGTMRDGEGRESAARAVELSEGGESTVELVLEDPRIATAALGGYASLAAVVDHGHSKASS